MKKIITIALAAALTLSLASCGNKAKVDDGILKVGASPAPHAEILEVVKPILEKEGITLEVVEFTDYVIPNTSLDDGDLDANYFQHEPYLLQFNKENKTDLVSAGAIHFEPLGIYPGKTATIADIKDGAMIAIPNDATNGARALLLLEANGIITLTGDKGLESTVLDIDKAASKKVDIKELAAEQIPNTIKDVDLAVINGNYAIGAGINKTVLASEDPKGAVAQARANIIAVQKGNENSKDIKALIKALQSDEVRKFIESKYDGSVVPVF
ncbi:MAG: MetQ/NlpA family ABC transporter substrate-binding protein [Oscillospiraceae bacterium]